LIHDIQGHPVYKNVYICAWSLVASIQHKTQDIDRW
jgi:hypothetical protein